MSLTDRFPPSWSKNYGVQVERNIGLVNVAEQDKIKHSKIAVLGTGGLGAPCAMQLAYCGCEHLVLCDFDTIEQSNLNRQPYTVKDIGKRKVDVLEKNLLAINPGITITKDYEVTDANIEALLGGVNVIALTLDGPLGSIITAREARKRGIPMIETWAIPYLFNWWFTNDSMDYESVYGLKTHHLDYSALKKDKNMPMHVKKSFISKLLTIPGIQQTYSREPDAFDMMLEGKVSLRSFAPIVWLNGSYAAMELIYAGILGIKQKVLAPEMAMYDYMRMKYINLK